MITATEGKNILKSKLTTEKRWLHDINLIYDCVHRCIMEIHGDNLDMKIHEISDIIFPVADEILEEGF